MSHPGVVTPGKERCYIFGSPWVAVFQGLGDSVGEAAAGGQSPTVSRAIVPRLAGEHKQESRPKGRLLACLEDIRNPYLHFQGFSVLLS